jgi:hypothetical protein
MSELQTYFQQTGYKTALVEAGHFYANKEVGDEQEVGVQVGQELIGRLSSLGVRAVPALFIDNYNASDPGDMVKRNRAVLEGWGWTPGNVLWERQAVGTAMGLIEKLNATENPVTHKPLANQWRNGSCHLEWHTPRTTQHGLIYDHDDIQLMNREGHLSCPVLDAASHVQRWQTMGQEGVCVTVLPDTYQQQQWEMQQVLRLSGLQVPIINAFYDRQGNYQVKISDNAFHY